MERERVTGRARLRAMIVIRRFEARVADARGAGAARASVPQRVGAEAVAVGAMRALEPDDAMVSSQGEHAHALARGLAPARVAVEAFARGVRRPRGAPPCDARGCFFCKHAIVTGGVGHAVGFALADAMLDRRRVTACRLVDGAVSVSEFHEALHLASLWRLPVVFLCEHDVYARGASRAPTPAGLVVAARRCGLRVERADALDAEAVERAVRAVAAVAREGVGPAFVELTMNRVRAQTMLNAEPACDVEVWTLRDPIAALYERLLGSAMLFEEDLARMEREVADEVDAAVSSAERALART